MPHYWPYTWHWFVTFFGINNTAGPQYGLWSGVAGSFVSQLMITIPTASTLYWWHHICVEHGCFRVGRHTYEHPETKTQVKACKRHHPHLDHKKPLRLADWHKGE